MAAIYTLHIVNNPTNLGPPEAIQIHLRLEIVMLRSLNVFRRLIISNNY